MRLALIVIMVCFGLAGNANIPLDISQVRDSFFNGWLGECGATKLFSQLENVELNEPILSAYKGAAEMTLANCVSNPFKKYHYFNDGKAGLESAVANDPENFEIRYLRFVVQGQLPAILNYNNKDEDRQFLIESLLLQSRNTIPDEYMNFVLEQIIQSNELSQDEKKKLSLLLNKN